MKQENLLYITIIIVLLIYSIVISGLHYLKNSDNYYINNDLVLNNTWNIIKELDNNTWNIIKNEIKNNDIKPKIILEKIDRNFFVDNLKLKDYSWTKFKLTDEWKKLITNIRSLHKSASLIWKENADREVCAWYIWTLSEKLWWKGVPYHIWMLNTNSWYPSKAWELPTYYAWLWWDILIDFSDKFSLKDMDYYEKISKDDLKLFFKTAFLEESMFWDIWFLYKDTKYVSFLRWWSSNSHITKNIWYSEFEFIVWQDYTNLGTIDIISKTINCDENINKNVFNLLENYKLFLNNKRIVLKDNELFYLSENNEIWDKIKLKYLDKISYQDVTLSHYFSWRSNVNGLFDMTCSWNFLPINVISINSRLIEKM